MSHFYRVLNKKPFNKKPNLDSLSGLLILTRISDLKKDPKNSVQSRGNLQSAIINMAFQERYKNTITATSDLVEEKYVNTLTTTYPEKYNFIIDVLWYDRSLMKNISPTVKKIAGQYL